MKIRRLWISGFRQFKNTYIDFTNPSTGESLDKICFIGANGTGKSTLLILIDNYCRQAFVKGESNYSEIAFTFAVELEIGKRNFILFNGFFGTNDYSLTDQLYFDSELAKVENWFEKFVDVIDRSKSPAELNDYISEKGYGDFLLSTQAKSHFHFIFPYKKGGKELLIYSPSEGFNNSYLAVQTVPDSNVNAALELGNNYPFYHIVSNETVNDFWTQLIYQIKQRESEREIFENKEENINKTKKELIKEFDEVYPKILVRLAEVWNRILEKAGLFFDAEGASNPVQLTDNLAAYIYTIEGKKLVDYSQLSTGIRNFIFRIGHIYSLYFNREIKQGIVLMDEPENSLFPDFLYDLIETYQQVMVDRNNEYNTQFFVATHSPIIAAQFEPHERIILEWDEPGSVKAHKGKAPNGDDPNDILTKDFEVAHLMGKKGLEEWDKFVQLKKQLRHTTNEETKSELVDKITEIGSAYNF